MYILIVKDCHGDSETLLLTVEALKAQLEEQTKLCKDQVNFQTHVIVVCVPINGTLT